MFRNGMGALCRKGEVYSAGWMYPGGLPVSRELATRNVRADTMLVADVNLPQNCGDMRYEE